MGSAWQTAHRQSVARPHCRVNPGHWNPSSDCFACSVGLTTPEVGSFKALTLQPPPTPQPLKNRSTRATLHRVKMPGTESKEAGAGNAAAEKETGLDKGKQPAVAGAGAGADEEVADVPDDDHDDQDEDDAGADTQGKVEDAGGSSGKKKKKSKRKKVKAALSGKPDDQMAQVKSVLDKLPQHDLQDLISRNPALLKDYNGDSVKAAEAFKKLSLDEVMTGLALSGKNAKDMASYKFWKTQPVPRFDEEIPKDFTEGPLKIQTVDDVPKEAPKLGIEGFEWVTMDLTNDEEIKEVYQLLNGHYVEDDESMFRFNYGTAILKW